MARKCERRRFVRRPPVVGARWRHAAIFVQACCFRRRVEQALRKTCRELESSLSPACWSSVASRNTNARPRRRCSVWCARVCGSARTIVRAPLVYATRNRCAREQPDYTLKEAPAHDEPAKHRSAPRGCPRRACALCCARESSRVRKPLRCAMRLESRHARAERALSDARARKRMIAQRVRHKEAARKRRAIKMATPGAARYAVCLQERAALMRRYFSGFTSDVAKQYRFNQMPNGNILRPSREQRHVTMPPRASAAMRVVSPATGLSACGALFVMLVCLLPCPLSRSSTRANIWSAHPRRHVSAFIIATLSPFHARVLLAACPYPTVETLEV